MLLILFSLGDRTAPTTSLPPFTGESGVAITKRMVWKIRIGEISIDLKRCAAGFEERKT